MKVKFENTSERCNQCYFCLSASSIEEANYSDTLSRDIILPPKIIDQKDLSDSDIEFAEAKKGKGIEIHFLCVF